MSEPIYDILKVKDDLGIWHVIPALKGNRGNGIASLQFSLDGTLTITDDDGEVTTYTGITSALAAIGTRQQEIDAAELSRVLAEQTRAGAEEGRQNSETIRRNAETIRNADEALRRNAESARDAAELLRASAESTRHENESTRTGNENTRQDNEAARAAAETARATAETGRATAETARQTAEAARASAEEDRETLYDQVSGMTADAETLTPGSSATATKQTDAQGNINFHFGIPCGTPGEVPAASIATKETSTTASRAYAAGEYFWMNGSLYKTTAAITSGGTITPGTNCALAKLGDDVGNLKSAIAGEMNGTNGITDYVAPRPFTIDSSKVWKTSTSEHISIPVNAGDTVSITANSNFDAVYAALKSDNAALNVAVDFCDNTGAETWQERKVITKNNTVQFTAPSDCNILYVAIHPNNASNIMTPKTIIINGVNISYNIRKKIDEIANDIESLDGDVSGINSTLENIESEQGTIKNTLSQKANKKNLDIWGMRGEYGRMFSPVDFSSVSFLAGFDLPVFTDGYKIVHSVDLSKYKNTSANTVAVSTNAELATAISEAVSGDTIVLNDGVYEPIELTKSVNLTGKGNPVFVTDDVGEFDTTGSDVVFRTVKSFSDAITDVYDASRIDEGIIIPLTKRNSVSGVVNNPGSWMLSSSSYNQIYVHLYDGRIATNRNVILCDKTKTPIRCIEPTENATIYIENITVVGGSRNILYNDYGSFNTQKLIAKNSRFYFAREYNNVSLFGVDGFFQNCEASYSHKDGFNYHKNNSSEYPSGPNTGTIANCFEIDCIGHDNGYDDTAASPSDNGSTMHNGGEAVRINGIYYHNKGGNVADTGIGTISHNYCCYAFDNMAPQDTNNADFWANSSATMYLYGCRSDGDSQYNLWAQGNATIHASKTEYTTKLGNIVDE